MPVNRTCCSLHLTLTQIHIPDVVPAVEVTTDVETAAGPHDSVACLEGIGEVDLCCIGTNGEHLPDVYNDGNNKMAHFIMFKSSPIAFFV